MAGRLSTITRRGALLAGGAVCGWWLAGGRLTARAGRRSWTVTPVDGAPDDGVERLRVVVLGDTGHDSPERARVVAQLEAVHAARGFDLVAWTGDTVYPAGPSGPDDPAWDLHWRAPFADRFPDVPFVLAIGNHDVQTSPDAVFAYAAGDPQLVAPSSYFEHVAPVCPHGATASLFALESQAIRTSLRGDPEQVGWLEDALAASPASWKLLVTHHPLVSGGHEGGSSKLRRGLADLMEEHDVDFVLSGHSHDLELLDPGGGWLQVVSGSGSWPRAVETVEGTRYCSDAPGFARLVLGPEEAWVEFWTADEGELATAPDAAFHLERRVLSAADGP